MLGKVDSYFKIDRRHSTYLHLVLVPFNDCGKRSDAARDSIHRNFKNETSGYCHIKDLLDRQGGVHVKLQIRA